jgi:hypothetical protein
MTMSDDNEENGYVMKAVVATDTDAITDRGDEYITAGLNLDRWRFRRHQHEGIEVLIIRLEGQTEVVHVLLRPQLAVSWLRRSLQKRT